MLRHLSVAICVLASCALLPSPAHATANAFGVNLTWGACYADGGQSNRQFACNTNAGSEQLFTSVVVDQPVTDIEGLELTLLVVAADPALPQWWSFLNAGSCRSTSLVMSVGSNSSAACEDWGAYFNGGVAAFGAYDVGFAGANTARVRALEGVPTNLPGSMGPGVEYITGVFIMNHQKTVGAGACAGCTVPVCIVYSSVNIATLNPASNRLISVPANSPSSQWVGWQGGQVSGTPPTCTSLPTPTNRSTWSGVKALYH